MNPGPPEPDTGPDVTSEPEGGVGGSGGQRVGHIVDRLPFGGGADGRTGTFVVCDDEDGRDYSFDYSDIVTEGFRTIRTGERVRFLLHPDRSGRASYVIRLDLPDVEAYYT